MAQRSDKFLTGVTLKLKKTNWNTPAYKDAYKGQSETQLEQKPPMKLPPFLKKGDGEKYLYLIDPFKKERVYRNTDEPEKFDFLRKGQGIQYDDRRRSVSNQRSEGDDYSLLWRLEEDEEQETKAPHDFLRKGSG